MAKKKDSLKKKRRRGSKGIVRFGGTDVYGETTLRVALMGVKGINHSLAEALSRVFSKKYGFSAYIQVGDISEDVVEKINEDLERIHEFVPEFLLNRRKDPINGNSVHLITNELRFALRQDVEREKKIWSWKGYRHAYGLPVRGQKARHSGKGGRTLGVVRKKGK